MPNSRNNETIKRKDIKIVYKIMDEKKKKMKK